MCCQLSVSAHGLLVTYSMKCIALQFAALIFLQTCFRLRPAAFFCAAGTGVWSRDRLLQVFDGSCDSSPLALVAGSVAASDDDVIHGPEVDKSMSGLVDNVADAGCRSHSLDWNVDSAEKTQSRIIC